MRTQMKVAFTRKSTSMQIMNETKRVCLRPFRSGKNFTPMSERSAAAPVRRAKSYHLPASVVVTVERSPKLKKPGPKNILKRWKTMRMAVETKKAAYILNTVSVSRDADRITK